MTNEAQFLPRQPRPRLVGMTVLLALAIVLSAALAWQALASANRHRAIAEQALNDYADFAAFVLATGMYRDFGLEVLSWFGAMPPWNTREAFQTPVLATGCGSGAIYFEYEPGSGELRHGGATPSAESLAHLRDTLVHSATLLDEAGWRFRLIRLDLDDAGSGVFIASTSLPGGFGVRGVSSCLWGDSTFIELMRRGPALPTTLTGNVPPDSLYAVSVGDPHGIALYVSPAWYPPDFVGSSQLGPEFGDLVLNVTLNPDIAPELVIGGLPPSRLPSTLGLFALSAVLLIAAAMQLRRESKLIAARSDFVSSVSHELRTPLSQILIFTELLKLNRLRSDDERARSLDIIDKETRRLIRMVENVLQFSRTTTASEPIDNHLLVLPVVRETVDAFSPLAEARDVRIVVDVPPELRVRANRNGLRQVLLNLLDNAVKYGPVGQTIRVESRARGGEIELAVEDQGPGIPAPERERIWDGFQRLEREVNSSVSGSGIGLSVVRSLVAGMKGHVRATDSSTGGARFLVTFPRGSEDDRSS